MTDQTETDTHSPWYECFEPQTQADAPDFAAADPVDADGAIEALFDYYNA